MKVLYISSGFLGIYAYKDQWVLESLKSSGIDCRKCRSLDMSYIQSIVEQFKPDVMFTLLGYKIEPSIIKYLKSKNMKLAVWFTEDPFSIDLSFSKLFNYDYVFTIDSNSKEKYKERGHSFVYHVPLGINPDIFKRDKTIKNYESDICLVGTPYPQRVQLVRHLISNTKYTIQIVGPRWDERIPNLTEKPSVKLEDRWVSPTEVNQIYQKNKIVINPHRPSILKINKNRNGIKNHSINVRAFEMAACGAFQLISDIPDLHDHFHKGTEIISYKDKDELVTKIHYYMKYEDERKAIAVKAMKRVMGEHTYQHRIKKILSILKDSL